MGWTFKLHVIKNLESYWKLNCNNQAVLVPKHFILNILSTKIDHSSWKSFENKVVNSILRNWTH